MNVLIIQFVLKMMCEKAVKDILTTVYLAAMCCTCRKLGRAWKFVVVCLTGVCDF